MNPYLPPELLEPIFEQVEDEGTLAACSLTCRAWAPIAQSKYFRNIRFGPPPSNDATRFLKLIRERPHIALLPRSIRSNQWDQRREGDSVCLAQIAPSLSNMTDLSLEALHLVYQFSRHIVEAFPSLQELRFVGCTVGLHFLSSIFQAHPTLHRLAFYMGTVVQANTNQELLPLRQLQHLQLFNPQNISLLVPLLFHPEAPLAPIERLLLCMSDSDSTCTLLFGLRHTLHVLEINASYFQDGLCTSNGTCNSIDFFIKLTGL